MKRLVLFTSLLALGGCSWLQTSGQAHYFAEIHDHNTNRTYTIDLRNSKDIGDVDAGVRIGDMEVWLRESEVSASNPMVAQAQAMSQLTSIIERLLPLLPASPREPTE